MSKKILLLTGVIILLILNNIYSNPKINILNNSYPGIFPSLLREQARLDANNIDSWIVSSGIFDHDIRTSNTPGFMWPKGTNRFAFYTAGLSIAAYIEGQLRMATCTFIGEYKAGYINISGGVPTPVTNTNFKLYKVTNKDSTSPDYLNWGLMIPYGAPYVDRNNNGQWDAGIDRPGIKNASQTIFVCMTDGFPETHNQGEGFPGGTAPIYSEMQLTAWAYKKGDSLSTEPLNDVQYFSYVIINKSTKAWNNAVISVSTDPDLGEPTDDYIGSDTILKLGYIYNWDNTDGSGSPPSYGETPPAAGISYFLTPHLFTGNPNDSIVYYNPPGSNNRIVKKQYRELGMTSFTYFGRTGGGGIMCEWDPGTQMDSYHYLSGVKRDGSPWFHPYTKQRTKKLYTGNPETLEGWTEYGYNGNVNMAEIRSCAGGDSITTYMSPPRDRRFLLNTGGIDYTLNAGDTMRILFGQMVARGTNNVNSVTKLKDLCRAAKYVYETNFPVSVFNISNEVPTSYSLGQNYPNPFNQTSIFKFQCSMKGHVNVSVYDITGREVSTLVNETLQPGTYEVRFDGSELNSGVYFVRMTAGDFSETRKMVLLK